MTQNLITEAISLYLKCLGMYVYGSPSYGGEVIKFTIMRTITKSLLKANKNRPKLAQRYRCHSELNEKMKKMSG